MKPSNIAYCKFNNLAPGQGDFATSKSKFVFCTRNDLKNIKKIKLGNKEFSTAGITAALLLQEKLSFAPDGCSKGAYSLNLHLVQRLADSLNFVVSFSDAGAACASITLTIAGAIEEFGPNCEGANILELFPECLNSNEKLKLVEAIAFNIGLYLLAEWDGAWDEALKAYAEGESDLQLNPEKLAAAEAYYQKQLTELAVAQEQMEKEYNILLARLSYQEKQNKKRITALSSNLQTYLDLEVELEPLLEEEPQVKPAGGNCLELLKAKLQDQRIAVVGGKEAWQAKLCETFANVQILDSKNFSPAKMDNIDLLIINTNDVGHSLTGKAQNIAFARNIRIIFTSKYNMERFAEEILRK